MLVTSVGLVMMGHPQVDGKGYQRRATEIVESLRGIAEVRVVSFELSAPLRAMLRGIIEIGHHPGLPLQVAWVRGLSPADLEGELSDLDLIIFLTSRVVPQVLPQPCIVDLVDSLGLAAGRRATICRGLARVFWMCEARRMDRWERHVVGIASASVTVCQDDADHVGHGAQVIPLILPTITEAFGGRRVVFTGNLRFRPNEAAAIWFCDILAPSLKQYGLPISQLLIAGRAPRGRLRRRAARAGVELRADVATIAEVLRDSAVAVAPMSVATGQQSKVLDAVATRVPVVMSPVAARGLPLRDGASALIRERSPDTFAGAVAAILNDPDLGRRLASQAILDCKDMESASVHARWRTLLATVLDTQP
ncbi:MAG: glycosyltransferase [Candidatus Dormiibacterota bacterium]